MHPIVIWSYRTAVLVGFALVGVYWFLEIDLEFMPRWAQVTTALSLFFAVYSGFRLKVDRSASNEFFLSLFWLVFVTCVMFSLMKAPPRIILLKRL